jgi:putative DNA primase/helicase
MSVTFAIARALHGRSTGAGAYLVRCPVPSHGNGKGDRNPSLMIKDGDKPGRVLVHCYAGCASLDILAELRRRNFLQDDGCADEEHGPATSPEPTPKHEPDPEALKIWRGGTGITPDHVAARFLAARGLVGAAPPSLRASSILHLDQYPLPAMVAAVQAPERQIIAVQTTLIDPRGDRKAQVRVPRKTVGALGWGAVRLAAAGEALGLAEGTEKALAAMQLFDVPCWSTLGGGRMHRVWVPPSVRELFLFADNDDCGRAAVERTAHAHRHRRVIIKFPPDGFKDWDDVTAYQAKERETA